MQKHYYNNYRHLYEYLTFPVLERAEDFTNARRNNATNARNVEDTAGPKDNKEDNFLSLYSVKL